MFFLYFLLWILFNGACTLEICLLGIPVAAAVFAFTCKFMGHSLAKERKLLLNTKRAFRYCVVLVSEIIKANLSVIRMILSEEEEIQPALFHFHADMKTPVGKTLLANAITLTPGTITVRLEGEEYTVHCLDESLALGSADSVFVKMLSEMEEE